MKLKRLAACLITGALILGMTACESAGTKSETKTEAGNFTDEMKMEQTVDISEVDGANSIERDHDKEESPYFAQLDYYNMESTDTLTILPHFKTLQQSSEWSCGLTAILMVMNYYDMAGDYDEHKLSLLRPQKDEPVATSLPDAITVFDEVGGFELETTRDYGDKIYEEFTLADIREYLENDTPVLICWNDWGGHWQVIIGYDTMGTQDEFDDVIIVADPYDATDHNQDGYGVYSALRFFYNFTTYDYFSEEEGNDMLFITAKPTSDK